jgi:hypothetical protein
MDVFFKKHYPWSGLTNKNTSTFRLTKTDLERIQKIRDVEFGL